MVRMKTATNRPLSRDEEKAKADEYGTLSKNSFSKFQNFVTPTA